MTQNDQADDALRNSNDYYTEVGKYFDYAMQASDKNVGNGILNKLKDCFRAETEAFRFNTALEIGYGPGEDLLFYSKKYPERQFFGVDVSKGMYYIANNLIQQNSCENVTVKCGTIDDIQTIFPDKKFDMIYVYFGALNTVTDLHKTATILKKVLNPGGKIVVTFINKWHLTGILLPFIKGRWKIAFKRLRKNWGGYSPHRHLDSKCYTPRDIKKAFVDFKVVKRIGYSIIHPAWYQNHLALKLGKKMDWLWKIDEFLNKTPAWCLGEYTLFIFEHKG